MKKRNLLQNVFTIYSERYQDVDVNPITTLLLSTQPPSIIDHLPTQQDQHRDRHRMSTSRLLTSLFQ